MATHDYVIDNQTAPNFRADLNNALLAIVSNNSGSTEPPVTYANMMWYDTANNLLRMRNEADDAFITLGTLDQVANTFAATVALASQAQAQAGTDNANVMTPLRGAQAIAAQTIGVGQTWQAVTRSVDTNFTNNTGRPIMLAISGNATNASQQIIFTVDGVAVRTGSPPGTAGQFVAATIIIPAGAVYSFTNSLGTISNIIARELR